MTSYRVDIGYNGQAYSYPDGPFLPGLSVEFLSRDVIVHHGQRAGLTPYNLMAHTVQLFRDGVAVTPVYNVPFLLWHSEYGFDLFPEQPIRSPQKLYDQGLILPIGPLAPGRIPAPQKYTYSGPADLINITTAMGTTGERPEIALYSSASADYMFTGDFAPVCAFAKKLRPFAVFVRDERTNKPMDNVLYPKASTYSNQIPPSTSPYYIAPYPADPNPKPANWPQWDWSHEPEAAYIAFCITGELRYLRICQYYANDTYLWSDFKNFKVPFEPTIETGQTRGTAWNDRAVTNARRATELAEQMGLDLNEYGLMPSSYWKALSDNNLRLFKEFYMADPAIQGHRTWPMSGYTAIWQQDYLGEALALRAFHYPAEVEDLYLWDLGNLLPRVDGKSGFPVGLNSAYRLNFMPNAAPNTNPPPLTKQASDFQSNWGLVYQSLKDPSKYLTGEVHIPASEFALLDADQYYGDNFALTDFYYHHLVYARLAMAMYLDTHGPLAGKIFAAWPELKQSFARVLKMELNWMAKAAANIVPSRVSFLPNPPGSFPVPPSLPPAGEIHMSNPGDLLVGQSAHFTLTYDDGNGNPSQSPVNLKVTVSPPGAVTIVPDATGGVATGAIPGPYTITASADNCAPVSISGSVSLPLAQALHLAWG